MKKNVFILFFVLLLFATAMAQEKKVAVLDPVGLSDKNIGTIVREEISASVFKIAGYTLLERKEIDKVLDENRIQQQDFFDETQVVKAGKLMGANFVLLTFITDMKDNNYHISCKMINVETASVENIKTTTTKGGANNFIAAVNNIVIEMFGSNAQPKKIMPAAGYSEELIVKGAKVFTFDKELKVTNGKLTTEEVRDRMKINAGALKLYNYAIAKNKKANHLVGWGTALTASGVVISCLFAKKDYWYDETIIGFVTGSSVAFVGGIAMLIPGIVFKVQAQKDISKAVDMYNKGTTISGAEIKFGFTGSGVGMAVKF